MPFPKPFLTPFVTYSKRVIQSIVGMVTSSSERISELVRTTSSITKTVVSSAERISQLVRTTRSTVGNVVSIVTREIDVIHILQSKTSSITSSVTRTVSLILGVGSKTRRLYSFVESFKITLYPQQIVFRKTFPMRFSSMHMADRYSSSHVGKITSESKRIIELVKTIHSYIDTIVSFVTKREDVLYDIYEDSLMYSVEPDTMMYEVLIE